MRVILSMVFAWQFFSGYGQVTIQDFKLPDVSGNVVSLQTFSSSQAVVVIFAGNECAFSNFYTSRIASWIEKYSRRVQFVLINSNTEPGESLEKMSDRIKSWGFNVPYLADKSQVAMDIFGARKNPEAFLLKGAGGNFQVVYQGALDDNPQVSSDVKQHYLTNSIDQLLANQKIAVPAMRATGCSIRKK